MAHLKVRKRLLSSLDSSNDSGTSRIMTPIINTQIKNTMNTNEKRVLNSLDKMGYFVKEKENFDTSSSKLFIASSTPLSKNFRPVNPFKVEDYDVLTQDTENNSLGSLIEDSFQSIVPASPITILSESSNVDQMVHFDVSNPNEFLSSYNCDWHLQSPKFDKEPSDLRNNSSSLIPDKEAPLRNAKTVKNSIDAAESWIFDESDVSDCSDIIIGPSSKNR